MIYTVFRTRIARPYEYFLQEKGVATHMNYFDKISGSRFSDADLRQKIREIYGLELLNGMGQALIDESDCESENYPIASFKNVFKAYKITNSGGKNFKFLTPSVSAEFSHDCVVAAFCMATGLGAVYPEPSCYYKIYVNGQHAIDFRHTKYSERWENEQFTFYYDVIRSETAPEGLGLNLDRYIVNHKTVSFGAGFLRIPARFVKRGAPLLIEFRTFEYFPSSSWLRIDDEQYRHINFDFERGLAMLNERQIKKTPSGQAAFYGDIHSHSLCGVVCPCDGTDKARGCEHCEISKGQGTGCGHGTVRENYYHAEHISNLDFFTLTDHDFQLSDGDWQKRLETADFFNKDGRFAVLNGYEYTSWQYGHRNVYFGSEAPPIFRAVPYAESYGKFQSDSPREMFSFFEKSEADFFTAPHHMTSFDHMFNWELFDERYDKMVEIFSGWGNSEGFNGPLIGNGAAKLPELSASVQIAEGRKFGFVSGSDSHDGFPGSSQGSAIYNWANKYTEAQSGRTVVLCDNLTRREVFDGMKSRRAYATTGAPILADFSVNGVKMGGSAAGKGSRTIVLDVSAPCEIVKIQILRNGKVLFREFCDSCHETFVFTDEKNELQIDAYYARIFLKDREMAWITPVWISK